MTKDLKYLGAAPGDPLLAVRASAILRLLVPGANIPATSALGVAAEGGRRLALAAGANVIMPSVTPEAVRRDYAIYPGKNEATDSIRDRVQAIRAEIHAAGGLPSGDRGDSLVGRRAGVGKRLQAGDRLAPAPLSASQPIPKASWEAP